MWLRQSTAVVIPFGQALSNSDGVTLVTTLVSALDHVTTGIKLNKNGGAAAVRHATVTATTYDAYGDYLVTLDATDTNTLGNLRVKFADATTNLPMSQDFEVVPAAVYDAYKAASGGYVPVDVQKWLTGTIPAPATTGVPTVDAKYINGTLQTARDLGLSVLLAADQAVNATKWGGVAVTGMPMPTFVYTVPPTAAAIALAVEDRIMDETDGDAVLLAIVNKINSVDTDLAGLSLMAIAAQVRTNLAVELGRIDVDLSSRLAASDYTAPPTAAANATATATAMLVTPANKIATDSDNAIKLPTTVPAGYGPSGSGSGAYTVTQPVRTSLGAIMEGADVTMTLGGIDYTATSDAAGNAVFHLGAGTYAQAAFYPWYTFPAASAVITTHVTLSNLVGTATAIPTPADVSDCTVAFVTKHNGAILAGASITFECTDAPAGTGLVLLGDTRTATSDADGLVAIALPRTSQWLVKNGVRSFPITVPDAASYLVPNKFLNV